MKKKIEFVGRSRKIKNWEKESLVKTLVDNGFEVRKEKIYKKMAAFCDDMYQKFVSRYAAVLIVMPKHWKTSKKSINLNISGRSYHAQRELKKYMSEKRDFPDISGHDTPNIDIVEYPEIHKRLEKIDQEYLKLREHLKRVSAKTEGQLEGILSTRQLFDNWPQAYLVFEKKYPYEFKETVPMIVNEDLNKELGL